jgi:Predicted ferric reductase
MFDEDILLQIARFIGIAGLFLFILSGIGGALMASRTVQIVNIRWLRGKMFRYHRLLSLIGASLFLLHPIPMLFAPNTTGGMTIYHEIVPFVAPKQTITISLGIIAFYVLVVVTITSILIKYMKRNVWRALHYGTYIVIFLGLVHGLLVSGEFKDGEVFEIDEPEKILLMTLSVVALALPVWRVFLAKRLVLKKNSN